MCSRLRNGILVVSLLSSLTQCNGPTGPGSQDQGGTKANDAKAVQAQSIPSATQTTQAASTASSSVNKEIKVSGWVSDAKCKTNFDAACTKKCAAEGEKLVLVSDRHKTVYQVENQEILKGHEGHYVMATAVVEGNTLYVDHVAMQPRPSSDKH